MFVALQVVALILVSITMALSLAHALEFPGKMRLTREQYLAVQPIYYPGFTFAGAGEPLAVPAIAALLALTPAGSTKFGLTMAALIAAALTHLLYWLLTAPVNKVWLKDIRLSKSSERFFGMDAGTGPDQDWTALRDHWERSHLYRAACAMIAFVLLTIAIAI